MLLSSLSMGICLRLGGKGQASFRMGEMGMLRLACCPSSQGEGRPVVQVRMDYAERRSIKQLCLSIGSS
ncbi:MAG TPA: hypothetical protein VGJ00_03895 [Rhabdochlamydiaceae bacterium]